MGLSLWNLAELIAKLPNKNITPNESIITLGHDITTAILPPNILRTSLIIKNIGTETVNISLSGNDVTVLPGIPLDSGESITLDNGSSPATAVSGAALTADGATGPLPIYVMDGQ